MVLAAICLPVAVGALAGTLFWPGRTFPGFLVMGNRLVPSVGLYDWTGYATEVPFHARVTQVAGRTVRSSAEIYDAAAATAPGTTVTYTLEKGGETFTRHVPTMRFGPRAFWLTVGLFAAFGVVSVGAGLTVFMLQPRTPAALAFLLFGTTTGLFALTGSALYHPHLWSMLPLHLVAQALFPASFVHLGLVFPVGRRVVQRHPALLWAPYVVGLALAGWMLRDFGREPPDTTPLYAAYLLSAAGIVALVALLVWNWFEQRTPDVRPQLRSVLPGLVVGTAFGLYGFVDNARGGGAFPINLIALTPFVFFLAVTYAIARHDLFDIDALLKRAVVYGLLTLGITGGYAGTVALAHALRPAPDVVRGPGFTIAFVFVAALLFNPLRRLMQGMVDRVFHRGRPDYRRTVAEVSRALTSLLRLDDILDRVGRTVSAGLHTRSLAVVLWFDDGTIVRRFDRATSRMEPVGADDGFVGLRQWLAERSERPTFVARDGDDAPLARDVAALDAALVVPMVLAGRLLGAFVLGRTLSGRRFGREDVELLHTLGAQCAIAIGNARSYEALERANAALEGKVAARTLALETSHAELAHAYDELKRTQAQLVHSEKMASLGVLVAGVAHEINNPVSFIVGGVAPLREVVDELRTFAGAPAGAALAPSIERAGRAVEAIARGAERTVGIVQDLRTFSRLGDAGPRAVDVHEGIEVSLRLLQPRLTGRIAVERDYGDLPAIEAEPDELNQVWMNLLANAADAIVGDGAVRIATREEGADVVVTIRDDGVGIPAEALGRVFDPFFTSKPPGQGTGLGLAISHGIVKRHGGRITVVSRPGVGTTFTVVLPVRRSTAMDRVAS